ncbi:hypothetical protein V6Z12_1Z000400 [Gossypium hirsutum]
MDTKNRTDRLEKLKRELHFYYICRVPPRGLAGGLCLLWKEIVDFQVRTVYSFIMEVEVKDDDKNKRWMLDCIHADFDDQRRCEQWSLSQRVAGRRADGWVVLGDLKDLLPDDKEGGCHRSAASFSDFRNFLDKCGLLDVGFVVHPFTWFQKRQGSFNVKESFNLPAIGSDHSPILLNTEVLDSMKGPFFPYDSRWNKDEECAEVVKRAWQLNVRGSDLFKVQQKMTNCRVELLKWRS